MSFLNFADWIVIGVYLLAVVLLGVWFGKDQRNTRDYFLGGKNIPWWGIIQKILEKFSSFQKTSAVLNMAAT